MIDFKNDLLPGDGFHKALRELREQAPVAEATFNGMACFVILGHQALKEAFSDNQRFPGHIAYQFSIEQSIGPSFISMPDPEPHRTYRKLATPAFRSRVVAEYEQLHLAPLAHELLDQIEADSHRPVDLVEQFTSRFPYLVISRLLGLDREQESQFHHWAMALLLPEQNPEEAAKAQDMFRSTAMNAIKQRRRKAQNDVISELIDAEVDGRHLSDEEILSHIGLLFPTGGETTHGALSNLLYTLLSEPERWQTIKEDRSLIPKAVNEGLRWESSVAVLPRVSGPEDMEYYGTLLPANSLTLFAMASANRDANIFDQADEFQIEREANDTLEFGRGVKTCPGMHLARRNIACGIDVLLERFGDIRLTNHEDCLPEGATVRNPRHLYVTLGSA